MASQDKLISQLPVATQVLAGDLAVIMQGGITKQIDAPTLAAGSGGPFLLAAASAIFPVARVLTNSAQVGVTDGGAGGSLSLTVVNNTSTQKIIAAVDGVTTGTRHKLNVISGTNILATAVDNSAGDQIDLTINTSGIAGTTATYVTMSTDLSLTNERVLTAGTGLGLTDGGAGGLATLALAGQALQLFNLSTSGVVVRNAAGSIIARTITAGANVAVTNGDGVSGNPTIAVTGIGTTIEAWDADLDALAALATTGVAARTGSGTWSARTLTAPVAGFTITNPAGVAGDPTFVLADDLAAVEGLATTGIAARTAASTWTTRTITASTNINVSNGDGVAGNPTISVTGIGTTIEAWDADLDAIAALATAGMAARTGSNTWAVRTLTAPAAGITITNPAGTAGDPTLVLANDLAALEGLASTGFSARTATDAWSVRTITAPAAGFTITNPAGVAGNPTFVLANDLAAVEGLASNGIAARTATDTWAVRTLTAPAAGFTITNGDGVAGNPTFVLANDLAAVEALASNGIATRTATDTWTTRTITGTTNVVTVTNGDGVSGNPTLTTGSLVARTDTVQSFTVAQRGTATALTDAATVAVDAALANNFTLTIGGNRTLGNPTNLTAGQSGVITITQDGTGSRTLSYSSNWKFAAGTAPTLSTAASAVDDLCYYVESATRICASIVNGVA